MLGKYNPSQLNMQLPWLSLSICGYTGLKMEKISIYANFVEFCASILTRITQKLTKFSIPV